MQISSCFFFWVRRRTKVCSPVLVLQGDVSLGSSKDIRTRLFYPVGGEMNFSTLQRPASS